jgi:hypothetical protein
MAQRSILLQHQADRVHARLRPSLMSPPGVQPRRLPVPTPPTDSAPPHVPRALTIMLPSRRGEAQFHHLAAALSSRASTLPLVERRHWGPLLPPRAPLRRRRLELHREPSQPSLSTAAATHHHLLPHREAAASVGPLRLPSGSVVATKSFT